MGSYDPQQNRCHGPTRTHGLVLINEGGLGSNYRTEDGRFRFHHPGRPYSAKWAAMDLTDRSQGFLFFRLSECCAWAAERLNHDARAAQEGEARDFTLRAWCLCGAACTVTSAPPAMAYEAMSFFDRLHQGAGHGACDAAEASKARRRNRRPEPPGRAGSGGGCPYCGGAHEALDHREQT